MVRIFKRPHYIVSLSRLVPSLLAAAVAENAYVIVRMMVSIKEAAGSAMAFANDALGAKGLRLEEVESSSVHSQDVWLITLSMFAPIEDPVEGLAFPFNRKQREYKIFTVLKQTGEVTSMKIRELANA